MQLFKSFYVVLKVLQFFFQISSSTVCKKLHGMGFHGLAIAPKPCITKHNAKHRMLWCKATHPTSYNMIAHQCTKQDP